MRFALDGLKSRKFQYLIKAWQLCLETRPGRGRKPIMDFPDEEAVRKAVEQDRQRVMKAREAWQKASGKEAIGSTFRAFLSALAQDIGV